ncbi:hypothetical protein TWF225_001905 [Orbilia oligospora]|uniref:Actin-like ATPase domain-containing protein n=1 Tax=Orbilia oligospora TaxID=2813651 RepID=A0A7C8NMX9_ORBOL|nr:hypothetical protein TWF102_008388 [Orbilia oligospora]KAF3096299.1 hypothetical protein TWF103_009872 [Orbilia oligospora]KAF3124840.1 hypothetical protein TWF703_011199 [Orbilia oligospora]KAF3145441.1 hypothetical protein TWF594_004378 [Orbilia oligospora]KAF3190939.1 hypothetical protein TWF225_001905 [Orbilia oligospora]
MAKRAEIVIGIDFGTTFSGLSWAVNLGEKRVSVVNSWETLTSFRPTNDKVPTQISYTGNEPTSYGYTANKKPFKWFKVLLQQGHYSEGVKDVRAAQDSLLEVSKSIDEVVSDYLRWLWGRGKEDISRKQGSNFEEEYECRVVLTVPAVWSPVAKDRTLKAAKKAGLPSNIKLVTEPEAAALATLKEVSSEERLNLGDVFIVCDAGGGTVDLISYMVTEVSPLQIRECGVGEGGLCGSIFLDLAFENFIKTKVGELKYNSIQERHKKKMLDEFENQIKWNFEGDAKRLYSVELRGAGDDQEEDEDLIEVEGGTICSIFDDVCGRIDALVENQMEQIKAEGRNTKAILLVGGFGSSRYLYSRLNKIYKGQGISVLQSKDSWSAVCRGATMWGLEHNFIVSRNARYSYGSALRTKFIDGEHEENDRVWDASCGVHRASDQMVWVLKRGEEIRNGRVVGWKGFTPILERKLMSTKTHSFTRTLYYSEQKTAPRRRLDGAIPLATISFEIDSARILKLKRRKGADGNTWIDVHSNAEIKLHNADLGFNVFFEGESVGYTQVEYKEDSG